VARLSRVTDDGKSRIERDDDAAQEWARANGRTVAAMSEDRGVSGATDPFKRPSLGPWLTDPVKMAQYDEIVASSLDRLGRNARDLHRLQEWAEDHGKQLTIRSPQLHWPPEPDDFASPIIWDVLGRVAEIELRITTKRYADARSVIADNGGLIGKPPWGFVAVGEKYAKKLEPDLELRPYLLGMVERALRGDTYRSIGRWLDSEGIEPPKGGRWVPTSVINVLRNPALKGRRVHADGRVVKFEGVLSAARFAELQAALDNRPGRRGPITAKTPMLTGVIECGICGCPMYRSLTVVKGKEYSYYVCKGLARDPSRCRNAIKTKDVEDWLDIWFLADGPFADIELVELVTHPGHGHEGEIADIDEEIKLLDPGALDYLKKVTKLHSERQRLVALPKAPTVIEERGTGQTVGEVWGRLDEERRRRYLMAAGIKVKVRPATATEQTWLTDPTTWSVPEAELIDQAFNPDYDQVDFLGIVGKHFVHVDGDAHQVFSTLQHLQS
jgi:site-specific DNA recombinase